MLPAISVVIPAFNEAVRIGDTLATSIAYLEKVSPGSELIVINDGSTDSTGEVIRKVAAVPSSVAIQLLENFPNRGKGAAVRSGLLSATKPIAVFFDADLSTPIDELPKIVDPIARGEVDIAFGSRGFKAFRMEACRPIIEAAKIIGFGFDVELLLLAQRAGLRLREIPVRWNHHEGSKVRFVHDSVRMLREVLSLRANNAVNPKGA